MFPFQCSSLRFDGKCISKNDYADCCKKKNANCAIVSGHLECLKYGHKIVNQVIIIVIWLPNMVS